VKVTKLKDNTRQYFDGLGDLAYITDNKEEAN
jgi:hypothetical protein